jgi:hypothetical protein
VGARYRADLINAVGSRPVHRDQDGSAATARRQGDPDHRPRRDRCVVLVEVAAGTRALRPEIGAAQNTLDFRSWGYQFKRSHDASSKFSARTPRK